MSRHGRRDDRRRRLLTEELSNFDAWPLGRAETEDAMPQAGTKGKDAAGGWEPGLRLVDCIPQRWLALGVTMATIAAVLVSLEVAYGWMLDRAAAGAKVVTALDVGVKGSLACWFSSLVLLAAAAVALAIYAIRRQRADDYKGRYRVWLWAAGLWFFMASDAAASLGEAFGDAMIALSGARFGANGAPWWMAAYLFAGAAVGTRLVREMRGCRLSIGGLAAAAIAYAIALAFWFGWIPTGEGDRVVMFRTAAAMTGHGLLLAAMLLHARHVILVAHGLLPQRKSPIQIMAEPEEEPGEKPATAEAKPAPSTDRRWLKIDPPHASPPPVVSRPAAVAASVAPPASSSAAASLADHKLSKAERRALKERLLRERRQREER